MYCKKWQEHLDEQVHSVSTDESQTIGTREQCRPLVDAEPVLTGPTVVARQEVFDDEVRPNLNKLRAQYLSAAIERFVANCVPGDIGSSENYATVNKLFHNLYKKYLGFKKKRGGHRLLQYYQGLYAIFNLDQLPAEEGFVNSGNYDKLTGFEITEDLMKSAAVSCKRQLTPLHCYSDGITDAIFAVKQGELNQKNDARTNKLKWKACAFCQERLTEIEQHKTDALEVHQTVLKNDKVLGDDYKDSCISDTFEDLYDIAVGINNAVKQRIRYQGNTIQGIQYTAFEAKHRSERLNKNLDTIQNLEPEVSEVTGLGENEAIKKPRMYLQIMQGLEANTQRGATCGLFAASAFVKALAHDGEPFKAWIYGGQHHIVMKINTVNSTVNDLGLIIDLLSHQPYPVLECHYRSFDLSENTPFPENGIICGRDTHGKLGEIVQKCEDALADRSSMIVGLDWSVESSVDAHLDLLKSMPAEKPALPKRKRLLKKAILDKYLEPLELDYHAKKFADYDDILGPEFPQMVYYGDGEPGDHIARQDEWGTEEARELVQLYRDRKKKATDLLARISSINTRLGQINVEKTPLEKQYRIIESSAVDYDMEDDVEDVEYSTRLAQRIQALAKEQESLEAELELKRQEKDKVESTFETAKREYFAKNDLNSYS